ncbi:hypothetical protein EDD86DRAFT_197281 [Gorgonomyces haynaldii]|nr:hypothetical protein EDD86DRAFT_197281 [Gorgonomyces haynaldii]
MECPICLGSFRNKTFLEPCLHNFCFECILKWSKVSKNCPLCKRHFVSGVHTLKDDDYKRYYFEQKPKPWGRRPESPTLDESLRERQRVYSFGLRCRHRGTNRYSKFRDLSPQYLREHQQKLRTLVPWIRRELLAILRIPDVTIIIDFVLQVMQQHDLQSDEAIQLLEEYLEDDAEHFVHELVNFARSELSMEHYDRQVQYD